VDEVPIETTSESKSDDVAGEVEDVELSEPGESMLEDKVDDQAEEATEDETHRQAEELSAPTKSSTGNDKVVEGDSHLKLVKLQYDESGNPYLVRSAKVLQSVL
jgi:hypothetical protein